MKKKKLIIGIISVIVLIILGVGIKEVYDYYHPEIYLYYEVLDDRERDLFFASPGYMIGGGSCFGYAPKFDKEVKEMSVKINEVQEWIWTEFDTPIHVNVDIERVDGKTIFTYTGTAVSKATGKVEEINKQVTLDFIVTKEDIRYMPIKRVEGPIE